MRDRDRGKRASHLCMAVVTSSESVMTLPVCEAKEAVIFFVASAMCSASCKVPAAEWTAVEVVAAAASKLVASAVEDSGVALAEAEDIDDSVVEIVVAVVAVDAGPDGDWSSSSSTMSLAGAPADTTGDAVVESFVAEDSVSGGEYRSRLIPV